MMDEELVRLRAAKVTDEMLVKLYDHVKETLQKHRQATEDLNAALRARHPLQPGDVLRNTEGREARVSRLVVLYGAVKVFGHHRLKGGDFSGHERELWKHDWGVKNVTLLPPESR